MQGMAGRSPLGHSLPAVEIESRPYRPEVARIGLQRCLDPVHRAGQAIAAVNDLIRGHILLPRNHQVIADIPDTPHLLGCRLEIGIPWKCLPAQHRTQPFKVESQRMGTG